MSKGGISTFMSGGEKKKKKSTGCSGMPEEVLNSKVQGGHDVPEFTAIAKCFIVHCSMIKTHPVTHTETDLMMQKQD